MKLCIKIFKLSLNLNFHNNNGYFIQKKNHTESDGIPVSHDLITVCLCSKDTQDGGCQKLGVIETGTYSYVCKV